MVDVAELLARGRAAWRGVDLENTLRAWIEARCIAGMDLPDTSVLHEDLYLACACAEGVTTALCAFDAAFGEDFAALYRRFGYLPGGPDDVRQVVYEKLFVGENPKIGQCPSR